MHYSRQHCITLWSCASFTGAADSVEPVQCRQWWYVSVHVPLPVPVLTLVPVLVPVLTLVPVLVPVLTLVPVLVCTGTGAGVGVCTGRY